jgi:hypothetical protein
MPERGYFVFFKKGVKITVEIRVKRADFSTFVSYIFFILNDRILPYL